MRAIDADKLFAAFEDADWFDNADRDIAEDLLLDAPVVNQTEQPDPDTGLVPCGCGGKARASTLSGRDDWFVECIKCHTTTYSNSKEGAEEKWDRAMGRASE